MRGCDTRIVMMPEKTCRTQPKEWISSEKLRECAKAILEARNTHSELRWSLYQPVCGSMTP